MHIRYLVLFFLYFFIHILVIVTCQYSRMQGMHTYTRILHCKISCACCKCVYTTSPAGSPLPLLQIDLWKVKVVAWTAAPAASSSTCDSGLKGKLCAQLIHYQNSNFMYYKLSSYTFIFYYPKYVFEDTFAWTRFFLTASDRAFFLYMYL